MRLKKSNVRLLRIAKTLIDGRAEWHTNLELEELG